jgi:AcrR family transcriptional regulator
VGLELELDKEGRFELVADAVVTILLDQGPEALRYARLSRESGVSRAWLYKYFGKDRSALLDFAARSLGGAFAELEVSRPTDSTRAWRSSIRSGTEQALDDALATPWVVNMWFRFRHDDGPIGAAMREIESRHVSKFVAEMPRSFARRKAAAGRFARVFTATRFGAYFLWLDERYRAEHSRDVVVAEVMRPVDSFVAQYR